MAIRSSILEAAALFLALVSALMVLIALVAQPLAAPVASQPPPVDPARLEAHVRKLSVDLYPRSHDQVDQLDAAARYISQALADSGARLRIQPVLAGGQRYHNIIASFGPQDGPLMVIGAHYDSYANAQVAAAQPSGYSPQTHTPGADDNASGVAGLLELARLLGQAPPVGPIELVAYTLEEPPAFGSALMGSAWHASELAASGRAVRLMLSLEMIGYFNDAPASQRYPVPAMRLMYGDRADFIALVGKFGDFGITRKAKAIMSGATDLPLYSINAPASIPGIDFSDHRSYWEHGFPALMVTDTAFYRYRHYHQAGDTYEKLDYRRMAKVVQAVHALSRQY